MYVFGDKTPLRCLVSSVRQALLESFQSAVNVIPLGIHDADAHVTETDVLGSDLIVQTTGKDDTLLEQGGQD